MNANHPLKKLIVGVLLSGGVALAGLGMSVGTAQAATDKPGPTIDHPDWGGTLVQCNRCGQQTLPGITVSLPGFQPGAAH